MIANRTKASPPQNRRSFVALVSGLGLDKVQVETTKPQKRKSVNLSVVTATSGGDSTIIESVRNNTLTSMAGAMRRKGMTRAAIEAALLSENATRCSPPLNEDEVLSIAGSVARYEPDTSEDVSQTLNDIGNAKRFVAYNKEQMLYSPGIGWLIWDGLKWASDSAGAATEKAKEVVKTIYSEGLNVQEDELRLALAKHAKTSHNLNRMSAMVELAKSDPALVVHSVDLDRDDLLLGVGNGVVNLRDGKLRPAATTDRITRHSPVIYDKTATAPTFLKFLDTVTGGDKKLKTYLQRVVGYCLTGETKEQCLFFLYGSGSNGKSTFLNTIKELLGTDLSAQTPAETLMNRKANQATNDVARLVGKRLVVSNEVEEGSMLAEAFVKQITGGEPIPARFHYKEYFEFLPKFKLFIAGNHRPTIRGRDQGIWRRIRLIPFTVTIEGKQKDPDLMLKLREELPGILNWAIKGAKDWQKKGLAEPKTVLISTSAYRKEMDLTQAWISDAAQVGVGFDWRVRLAYHNYRSWAEGGGYSPMSESTFSRELESQFPRVKRKDANYLTGIRQRPIVVN